MEIAMEDDSDLITRYVEASAEGCSVRLQANTRIITGLPLPASRDCSQVKSSNIVQYGWSNQLSTGNLIAIHKDGMLMAYVLTGPSGSLVRVVHRKSKSRMLLKGFCGRIVDIAWAFCSSPTIISAVDETGSIHVYIVDEVLAGDEPLTFRRLLYVERNKSVSDKLRSYQLRWCPFVPENTMDKADKDDFSYLLGVFSGTEVCLLNVSETERVFGKATNMDALLHNPDNDGCLLHHVELFEITALTLSPDGTAISLGLSSGEVKFYVIEEHNSLRSAHVWTPHGSKPISSLIFLDNLKTLNSEQFWKLAVTCSDGNRDIKLWSCENWALLQRLRIEPPKISPIHDLRLAVDITGEFLVLSDTDRKSIYIIELDPSGVKMSTFSDFPIVLPPLCYSIIGVNRKRFRPFQHDYNMDEDMRTEDDDDFSAPKVYGVQAMLAVINERNLLELEIRYQPDTGAGVSRGSVSSVSTNQDLAMRSLNRSGPEEFSDNAINTSGLSSNEQQQRRGISAVKDAEIAGWNQIVNSHASLNGSRHISTSPSSQEVSNILSHSADTCGSSNAVDNITEPMPCMHGSADALSLLTNNSALPLKAFNTVKPKSTSPLQLAGWNPADAGFITPSSSLPTSSVVPNSMPAIDGQRILEYLKQQESELRQLKALIVPVAQEISDLRTTVKGLHEQREVFDQLLRGALLNSTSQGPDELKNVVLRAVKAGTQGSFEAGLADAVVKIREMMKADMADKLNATMGGLRENMIQTMKSQHFVDAISSSVAAAAMKDSHLGFREAFQKDVIPSFESAIRKLLNQINETFLRGCNEYVAQLQAQSGEIKRYQSSVQPDVVACVKQSGEQMLKVFEQQLDGVMQTLVARTDKQMQALSQNLRNSLRETVKAEISAVLSDHKAAIESSLTRALRSNAQTPAPSAESIQQTLVELLQQGRYNDAFEKALSLCDVNTVLFVCSKVKPEDLFYAEPCPLEQKVMLSLVRQLSLELNSQTELKTKYLQDSITHLDKNHPVVKQHVAAIVDDVQRKIKVYLAENPTSVHLRTLKIILMASSALLS